MRRNPKSLFLLLLPFICNSSVPAHQPVMDMAPRWKGGYGFQMRYETYTSDTFLEGNSEVSNPMGKSERVGKTWLEGVYTFTREVRVSAKLPYVNQHRTIVKGNTPAKESASGWGNLTLGLPLKCYENKPDSTTNTSITPQIRFPAGDTSGVFPTTDGGTDHGISFSYSKEKFSFYQYYDLYLWKNNAGRKGITPGNEIGFDANIGVHPYHNNLKNTGIFLLVDLTTKYEQRGKSMTGTTGGSRIMSGPVLVWYRNNIMGRIEYKHPIHEKVFDTQVSHGPQINVGIGFSF